MRVDFYQLGDGQPESVIATLAEKVLGNGERLLIVASHENYLARLDRMLWDQGPTGFLAHGLVDGPDDTRQPILLSNREDAPNLARNIVIADGEWREAALTFDRAFFLFGGATIEGARLTWKLLSGREGVERHYWANEAGKWVEKG